MASRSQYNLRRSDLVNQDGLSNVYRINDVHKCYTVPAFQEQKSVGIYNSTTKHAMLLNSDNQRRPVPVHVSTLREYQIL